MRNCQKHNARNELGIEPRDRGLPLRLQRITENHTEGNLFMLLLPVET
jgi:hypothetical protein